MTIKRTLVFALTLAAATACYRRPPADPATAVCTGKWAVVVTNRSAIPVDVMLVVAPSTAQTTLGAVKGNSRATFDLPKGAAKVSYQASDPAQRDGQPLPTPVQLRYTCSL